jgi:hypothetical protein
MLSWSYLIIDLHNSTLQLFKPIEVLFQLIMRSEIFSNLKDIRFLLKWMLHFQ